LDSVIRVQVLGVFFVAVLSASAGVLFFLRKANGAWLLLASVVLSVCHMLTGSEALSEWLPDALLGWGVMVVIVIYAFALKKRGILR